MAGARPVFPGLEDGSAWGADNERVAADLDGDGIGDALVAGLNLSGDAAGNPTGSRTAIARSGRDGRLLWKAVLEPPRFWFGRAFARSYALAAFPSPAGDLDGDGVPDVLVHTHANDGAEIGRRPATLPVEALSGRDGRLLWSAGPLPVGFAAYGFSQVAWCEPRVIEPNAPPDLVVLHRSPFLKASTTPTQPSIWVPAQERLARVSGRTGRVLWDIPLEEQFAIRQPGWPPPPQIDDLDGDGGLDAALMVRPPAQSDPGECEVKVISLRDGRSIWSRSVDYSLGGFEHPQVKLGRRKDDGRTRVFVEEKPAAGAGMGLAVHALDGRDGNLIWTWCAASDGTNPRSTPASDPLISTATARTRSA